MVLSRLWRLRCVSQGSLGAAVAAENPGLCGERWGFQDAFGGLGGAGVKAGSRPSPVPQQPAASFLST